MLLNMFVKFHFSSIIYTFQVTPVHTGHFCQKETITLLWENSAPKHQSAYADAYVYKVFSLLTDILSSYVRRKIHVAEGQTGWTQGQGYKLGHN